MGTKNRLFLALFGLVVFAVACTGGDDEIGLLERHARSVLLLDAKVAAGSLDCGYLRQIALMDCFRRADKRQLRRSGARLANGSDFPVEEPNPMLGFHAAITRQDREGRPPGGWMPDQRLTRAEALHSFTAGAAYAAHLERDLGTLRAGMLADLIVLSDDIMQIPAPHVLSARPLVTIRGGQVTFRDGL